MSKGKVCNLSKKKPAKKPKFKNNVAVEATPQKPIMKKWLNSTPTRQNAPENARPAENVTTTQKTRDTSSNGIFGRFFGLFALCAYKYNVVHRPVAQSLTVCQRFHTY